MTILDNRCVTARGAPLDPSVVRENWRRALPEHCAMLEMANGLELHGGLFRVFGVGNASSVRDALAWNQLDWRAAYRLPTSTIIWGENIFGDQFGFDISRGVVAMLNCEGGKLEVLPVRSPTGYLEGVLLKEPSAWIETNLVRAAERLGLCPSLVEHLSFEAPLMCGGAADESNLEVMDAAAHLDLLGQLVEQSRGVPEGTPIRGFKG